MDLLSLLPPPPKKIHPPKLYIDVEQKVRSRHKLINSSCVKWGTDPCINQFADVIGFSSKSQQGDISLDSKSLISQDFRESQGWGSGGVKTLLFKFIKQLSALLGPGWIVSLLSFRCGHFSYCILVLISSGVNLRC